jgi:hypothetical protein
MTLSQAGAVVFVFAVLAALRWALRRAAPAGGFPWPGAFDGRRPSAPLRRTARVQLTPTHMLHQIETPQGERYLLATYPGGVSVVSSGQTALATRAQGQSA